MFTKELHHFFNPDEFAVHALIKESLVKGILELSNLTVNQVHCCQFKFTCPQAAVPNIQPDDEMNIADHTYRILEINPDGTGLVCLSLERST